MVVASAATSPWAFKRKGLGLSFPVVVSFYCSHMHGGSFSLGKQAARESRARELWGSNSSLGLWEQVERGEAASPRVPRAPELRGSPRRGMMGSQADGRDPPGLGKEPRVGPRCPACPGFKLPGSGAQSSAATQPVQVGAPCPWRVGTPRITLPQVSPGDRCM